MPVLGGAVTFSRFRAGRASADPRTWLPKGLKKGAFEPLAPGQGEEDRAVGFVELEDHDATSFPMGRVAMGDRAVFGYRIDAIRIRGAEVKAELARWATAFEAEQGRPPAKREKAERREAIRQQLRQRTAPTTKVHDVTWRLKDGEIWIWAASRKAVEEIAAAIQEAFGVELRPATVAGTAELAEVDVEALGPTPELAGIGGKEVAR